MLTTLTLAVTASLLLSAQASAQEMKQPPTAPANTTVPPSGVSCGQRQTGYFVTARSWRGVPPEAGISRNVPSVF